MADWSEYEELTIFVHAKKSKCRWTHVAEKFPHRSKVAVRNKFINSLTEAKFGQHDGMFRRLVVGRAARDLGRDCAE